MVLSPDSAGTAAPPGRLQDKAVFVTGAASGMGRAIAQVFAREGARVAVVDRDADRGDETACLINDAGGRAVFLRADVTSEEDVREAVNATLEEFGRLDVLVNDAGIVVMGGAVNTSVEDWDRIHAINLRGAFLCAKHTIPHMQRQGGGAIVNVASIGGLVALPVHAAYNAAKAGLVGLTRQIAIDYGPSNIRVNCVCPTATDTPLIRAAGANDKNLKALADMHPLRRLSRPEDVAYAALFLASEEAQCITGAVLPVDAGWTAM